MDNINSKIISNGHIQSISIPTWWHKIRYEYVMDYILKNKIKKIADIGCGNLNLITRLREKDLVAIGFDNNTFSLNNYGIKHINLYQDFRLEEKFECIVALDVIEHLPDDQKFIKSCYENLAEGQFIILTAPAHNFYFSKWDEVLGHHRRYNKKAIRKILEQNGFIIQKSFYFFSFLSLPVFFRKLFSRNAIEDDSFPKFSKISDFFLYILARCEKLFILMGRDIFFGTSIFVVAYKKNILSKPSTTV